MGGQAGEAMNITKEHAAKFLELCDAGLSKGLGEQVPGKMCVEACWNAALGLPHGDDPPCVGSAIRAAKIALNDANWSGDMERARGMRAVGVAQAGSDQIDQVEFTRLITEGLERIKAQYPPADTTTAARYTADAAQAGTDEVLRAFANVILDALKELKSPGCEWLDLIKD